MLKLIPLTTESSASISEKLNLLVFSLQKEKVTESTENELKSLIERENSNGECVMCVVKIQ